MRDATLFLDSSTVTASATSAAFDLGQNKALSVQATWDVTTPAGQTFTTLVLASDTLSATAHGMQTGLKVRLTTTTTLPAGLALATDYYVINVSANVFKLASSLVDALAGTAVDVTDAGTGTHTVTAEALSATTKLQKSNDGTNWVDVHDDEVLGGNNSQTISADGGVVWVVPDAPWRFVRQSITLAGGQLTMSTAAVAK